MTAFVQNNVTTVSEFAFVINTRGLHFYAEK
jgi:hypothetical protein